MNEMNRRQALVLAAGITLAGYSREPEPVSGLEQIAEAMRAKYPSEKIEMEIWTGQELRDGAVVQVDDPTFTLSITAADGKRVQLNALLPVIRNEGDVVMVAGQLSDAYERSLRRRAERLTA